MYEINLSKSDDECFVNAICESAIINFSEYLNPPLLHDGELNIQEMYYLIYKKLNKEWLHCLPSFLVIYYLIILRLCSKKRCYTTFITKPEIHLAGDTDLLTT